MGGASKDEPIDSQRPISSYRIQPQQTATYREISSCESLGHLGVKILVMVPSDRTLSESDVSEIQNVGYNLYQDLQHRLHNSDPKEIAACKKEGEQLLALFGDEKIYVEQIPNEYWANSKRPWFLVTTKVGHIKIGWRKRVMVLDWSKTSVKQNANELFPDEDTTKDGRMIHAWSDEKAKEYLAKILGGLLLRGDTEK